MQKQRIIRLTAALASVALAAASEAATIPPTEEFAADVSAWEDAAGNPLFWEPSDSVDDSAYASADMNYFGFSSPFGGGPVVFRANGGDDASGDAFVGEWLGEGVTLVSAWVRHDAPADLVFFLRIASSFNFPGAVFAGTDPVAPDTWTQVLFAIDPNSPLCTGETVSCAQALASVGNLQLGTDAPAVLVALDQAFAIDVDKVTIVPEPGTGLLLAAGFGLLGLLRRAQRA